MPHLPVTFRSRLALILSASVVAIGISLVIVRHLPREPLSARIPSSTAIFDRDGKLLRLTLASDQQYRLWTPLEKVAPEFIDALLLHEDQHFYSHVGVNPASMIRATTSTYTGGTRLGGSTITMQLARLMYDLNTRSISGKLVQMARALQIEACYSKHDILEAHINLMPYGGNVQGVATASLIYFNKAPDKLALAEALSLVLIPQSPMRRGPRAQEARVLLAARERLFERWRTSFPEASSAHQYVSLPLTYRRISDLPFLAPHFSNQVLATASGQHRIDSTLDLRLQRTTERVLSTYVREHSGTGIHNASALLVDTRDMSVRALVGSADFNSTAIAGQVNGTQAKRSPGSALKPFIYALGIDQGLIHPMTVLRDAPTSFGYFSPENFDGRFVGPITATDALIRSRNVPAVVLASQLAQPNLYQFLHTAGISRMRSERHYGLALALGGGEVTMEETAKLYAMLANRGQLSDLRYLQQDPQPPSTRLLSEEASFMTLEMLKSAPRPEDPFTRRQDRVRTGWKTGTSWGFRDAWTAGVFGPYVLVTWVGNFDGHGNPAFVGVKAAAPLFFRIVDAIAAGDPQLIEPIFRQPPRLARIEVCSASGDLPNADCPQTSQTWYIPGVSPIRVSTIHRRVLIDTRTGLQACPPFVAANTRSEVFEYWPTELMQLFTQAGMPRRQPPASTDCQRDVPTGTPPRITSPVVAATYTVRTTRSGDDPIPLAANADSEVRRVHWFVDENYIGTATPGVAIGWNPGHAGHYVVRAVDDRGRADSRQLEVEMVH